MAHPLIDTNVVIRYLVEDPHHAPAKFRGVFAFFAKLETGTLLVELPSLVVFETFFVLTRLYRVPATEAAQRLQDLVSFQGLVMREKPLMLACLHLLQGQSIGLVDAYLLAWSQQHGVRGVYSYDTDLSKHGLKLLPVE